MSVKLRPYQKEAAQALFDDVKGDLNCHPVAVMPTGIGKGYTICEFINIYLSHYPKANVLVLSHNKEILKQDLKSLEKYFNGFPIGLYSSGLKSKTISKITIAGIQSVWKKPELFDEFEIIIIDEAHLVPIGGNTMYKDFLSKIAANYIGFTATNYRLGHGYIHIGKGALFNKVSYDLSSTENFNKLVSDGYLSELFAKPTALKLNIDGIKKVAGDYSKKDLSEKLDRETITEAAIIESIFYGKKYKKWLCFAIDIDHAENIKTKFEAYGIPAAVVHSKMGECDEQVIEDFKAGKYRVLINVNMLTVGFDVPEIDLIILLRPTQSSVLHVQTIGRGLRVVYKDGFNLNKKKGRLKAIKKGGKPHCLVLDFAGNVARLGPINQVEIKQKRASRGTGEAITKECPDCTIICHGSAKVCENCGHEFEFKEKIKKESDTKEIVSKAKRFTVPVGEKTWADVDFVFYNYQKGFAGRPDSIIVKYRCGLSTIKEQININSNGRAKFFANHWINVHWNSETETPPKNASEFLLKKEFFKTPKRILVDMRGKYPDILDAIFE